MDDRRTYEHERQIIEEAIEAALNKRHFPCDIQSEQLRKMQADITTLVLQMTGNGNPQAGVIYRFSLVEAKMKELVKERWLIVSVIVGLLIVAIWEMISK